MVPCILLVIQLPSHNVKALLYVWFEEVSLNILCLWVTNARQGRVHSELPGGLFTIRNIK